MSVRHWLSKLILENSRGSFAPKQITVTPHIFEQLLSELKELQFIAITDVFINGDLYFQGCKIVPAELKESVGIVIHY